MTVVLDSSGWIELLSGSSRAALYKPALGAERLIVPSIVRYEVGRYSLAFGGESACAQALRALSIFTQLPADQDIADAAARYAHEHKLAMADAFVYACAQTSGAELWTQDRHFSALRGVRFFPKE